MSRRSPYRRGVRPGRRPPRSSSLWFFVAGLAIVVVIGVVAVLLSRDDSDDGGSDTAAASEVAASVQIEGNSLDTFRPEDDDPAVGQPAPVATGEDFDGTAVTIGEGGRPQLAVFVAHWCPHCQAEVPRIVTLAQSGGIPSGVDLVGVATSTDEARPNFPPSEWLQEEAWPGAVLVDTASNEVANAYGLSSFPFFVVLDDQGRVVTRQSGELSEDQLRALVDEAARSSTPPTSSSTSSSTLPGS